MLKKVMIMVESKYSAIKAKMRKIETRLIIRSLLLQENKVMVQCFNVQNMDEDEDGQSDNRSNNSFAAIPSCIMQLAEAEAEEEEAADEGGGGEEEDHKSCDHSVSVIEMVKNAVEGQGKEFRLEEDIDQVADLFIQRFHHQIRLQKFHFEPPFL